MDETGKGPSWHLPHFSSKEGFGLAILFGVKVFGGLVEGLDLDLERALEGLLELRRGFWRPLALGGPLFWAAWNCSLRTEE